MLQERSTEFNKSNYRFINSGVTWTIVSSLHLSTAKWSEGQKKHQRETNASFHNTIVDSKCFKCNARNYKLNSLQTWQKLPFILKIT